MAVLFHIESLKKVNKSIIRLWFIWFLNRKVNDIQTKLEQIYGKGTVEYNGTTLQLEPGITNLFESSRDPKVLTELWVKWRDATGKKMANLYTEYVELENTGALEHGTQHYAVFVFKSSSSSSSFWYFLIFLNQYNKCEIKI